MPLVKLTMTAEVVGEKEVCVDDVLTCKLKVECMNLAAGQRSGYVHSKHYPLLRRSNWFLIITDANFMGLAAVEKIPLTDTVYEKEFKERASKAGKISFTALLLNDCYRGLDQKVSVEVNVLQEAPDREVIEYTKYDLREIRQLNAVQAALVDNANEETDSDEADANDEEDELRRKLKSAGLKKALTLEVGDDEEEEAEKEECCARK